MNKLKTWLRLVSIYKTPFISLRGNTWRIMQIGITRHYFATDKPERNLRYLI